MFILFCGDISNDTFMEWCLKNKKFTQKEKFEAGYNWNELKDNKEDIDVITTICTNNDHFLNGVRIAVRDEKFKSEDIQIIFIKKNENEEDYEAFEKKINSDGRIDIWEEGFFDQWDKALDRLF